VDQNDEAAYLHTATLYSLAPLRDLEHTIPQKIYAALFVVSLKAHLIGI